MALLRAPMLASVRRALAMPMTPMHSQPQQQPQQQQQARRRFLSSSASTASASAAAEPAPAPSMKDAVAALAGMERKRMSYVQAVNDAMRIALKTDPTTIIFGEDVGMGGVFRATAGLQEEFGRARVFNTPLTEQGIIGFGVGAAAGGMTSIAEVQFADYVFNGVEQLFSEAAKFRYRSGGEFNVGQLTIRMPCGAVGHGGLHHSQDPSSYFVHTPGLKVVMPSNALRAKGLLLAAIRDKNPVIFMEPKILYRANNDMVPTGDYELPLGRAEVVKEGRDVTIVAYGNPVHTALQAAAAAKEKGIDVEVVDLISLLPWDVDTVVASVKKTGRLIITHEAPQTGGFGGEIAAAIQERCFTSLEAPIQRVASYDMPHAMIFEPFLLPNKWKLLEAIDRAMTYDFAHQAQHPAPASR